MTSNQTLFPKAQILGAVVLAKSKIRRLAKGDRNLEEAYAFTSIDRFLEHINPICVEAGLVILMDEVAVADGASGARQGAESWLRITYDITLAHISGETLGPFRRHVDIPRSGPQAFGAAQSYVLKQFLRAQFQIATGEADDPDFGTKPPSRAPASDRSGIRAQEANTCNVDDLAMEIMGLRTCAQQIAEASSGRRLLSILAGLADEAVAHPMLKAARLQALTRIVSTAPSVAALEKLEQHFAGDWSHVADEAAHRRLQLDLLDSQAEEALVAQAGQMARGTASEEAPMSHTFESDDLGEPALNAAALANPYASSPVPPDTLDFGDIPYHEAAE
ncbi:ERF family protein [Fuscovulum ytuae]|uniref:ERF family protein n=1 Tax=Fuscovulum ytuae TaxID=3042299 RepID=A0ABY8Q3J5_9RHOB|nr:ERF family protein [Fuscovulum sp. YMD61]WGV15391.1 ERF family protein [Fuscovulum sp. YMD61]